jgi:diguanylate cyclase (GGDEF)-like protein
MIANLSDPTPPGAMQADHLPHFDVATHDGDRMARLVDLVAPRGLPDGLLRGLVFLVLVNALNWFVTVHLRSAPYGIEADLINTTVVALPFTALILALFHHQRLLQVRLVRLATTDMLTGLPNRRAFIARTRAATDAGQSGALLILDIDHFKRINDTYGHAVGDACLAAVADRLRRSLRKGDHVGRIGGEEFCVFLPGASEEDARTTGDRLCRAIAFEPEGEDLVLRVTLSAGATLGGAPTPLDTLMVRADQALYRAKSEGRARLVLWSDAIP